MTNEIVFIGVDIASSSQRGTIAVLSAQLEVKVLASASHAKITARLSEYDGFTCGIAAPSSPANGLMADKNYRRRLGLDPKKDNYRACRVGEYELRRRRIPIFSTPTDKRKAANWMKAGWKFYDTLRKAGVVEYPRAGSRRMFETFPQGGFTLLVGKRPYIKTMVEGLLQRQLILYEEGINISDPMGLLEEWTRYRILKGQLSREGLLSRNELDALMAAYTAFLLEREVERVTVVGDPSEGQIVLPGEELLDRY